MTQVKVSDEQSYVIHVTPFGTSSLSLTGSPFLTLKLPRADILKANPTLYFNAESDGDSNSDDVFMSNIACIWRSLKFKVGSEEIQNINEVGHLQSIDDNLWMSSDYRTGWAAICQGIPAIASSGTSLRYGMKFLRNSFLSNDLPLYKLPQVEIELELNQTAASYTNATTACTEVNVDTIELRCRYVRSATLKQQYDSNEVSIKFDDYEFFSDTTLLNAASSHNFIVPISVKSLTGIVYVMRNTADVNDPNYATNNGEKYTEANLTNAVTRLQYILDGQRIPKQRVRCDQGVELYEQLMEYNKGPLGSFWTGSFDTASDGTAIFAQSFEGNPFSNAVSGTNTVNKSGQLEIEMDLTASANTELHGWSRYNRLVRLPAAGGIVVSK